MTATSGPGFSLMMENIGLAVMTETPCVVANVQRAGPSTGLPTLVGQGDMMQARWGSHGPYEIIALCPQSPQEAFDLTVKAFDLAEQFRVPVFVMLDEVVGHMTERVVIPPAERIKVHPRRKPKVAPEEYLPYVPDEDLVPPMACAGEGYRMHITGLTHDHRGYPVIDEKTQQEHVRRLSDKIRRNRQRIIMVEPIGLEDAQVVIVAYGISARIAGLPMRWARQKGLKVGMLRLITAWPFPEEEIRSLAERVKAFVVPEINYGQMVLEVERCAAGRAKVVLVPHMGGATHDPEQIMAAVKECF
jgi:2-oxoglutarate ferredoxin oxidoreductase subunit alpha